MPCRAVGRWNISWRKCTPGMSWKRSDMNSQYYSKEPPKAVVLDHSHYILFKSIYHNLQVTQPSFAALEMSSPTSSSQDFQEDYYAHLGLHRNTAKLEDIKKAYRRLCLIYHPDKPGGDAVKFCRLKAAYDVLSDDDKRRQYDRECAARRIRLEGVATRRPSNYNDGYPASTGHRPGSSSSVRPTAPPSPSYREAGRKPGGTGAPSFHRSATNAARPDRGRPAEREPTSRKKPEQSKHRRHSSTQPSVSRAAPSSSKPAGRRRASLERDGGSRAYSPKRTARPPTAEAHPYTRDATDYYGGSAQTTGYPYTTTTTYMPYIRPDNYPTAVPFSVPYRDGQSYYETTSPGVRTAAPYATWSQPFPPRTEQWPYPRPEYPQTQQSDSAGTSTLICPHHGKILVPEPKTILTMMLDLKKDAKAVKVALTESYSLMNPAKYNHHRAAVELGSKYKKKAIANLDHLAKMLDGWRSGNISSKTHCDTVVFISKLNRIQTHLHDWGKSAASLRSIAEHHESTHKDSKVRQELQTEFVVLLASWIQPDYWLLGTSSYE